LGRPEDATDDKKKRERSGEGDLCLGHACSPQKVHPNANECSCRKGKCKGQIWNRKTF